MRRLLFFAASVAAICRRRLAAYRCAAAARTRPQLRRPLRQTPRLLPRRASRFAPPGGFLVSREPARRRRHGDLVEPDVRRRPAPPGRRFRRRAEQAGRLQRSGQPRSAGTRPSALTADRARHPSRGRSSQAARTAADRSAACSGTCARSTPRPPAPTASSRATSGVLVGIIDTGIDGTHPDIAPNFDTALSRNFTTDIPLDRRPVRAAGPLVPRPGERGRRRPRHARRRHHRRRR